MGKSSYYPGDDVKKVNVRDCKKPKATKLRKSIVPGTVLIILAGRFRGRRVVFLKQLPSGLLLVTGPYKINGVPLRRVNQAYVQPTSAKVDLSGVDCASIDDTRFAKKKQKITKNNDMMVFVRDNELSDEDKQNLQKKKDQQISFDKALIANIKKVDLLEKYLANRFTLRNNMRPHLLKF